MTSRENSHRLLAEEFDRRGVKHVPCKTCGEPTEYTGTRHCNGCHEVENRLFRYLREGGANAVAFIKRELAIYEATTTGRHKEERQNR